MLDTCTADEGGGTLDYHRTFVVRYAEGEDVELAYHYDDAEVRKQPLIRYLPEWCYATTSLLQKRWYHSTPQRLLTPDGVSRTHSTAGFSASLNYFVLGCFQLGSRQTLTSPHSSCALNV
jgi:hypothetical protein